MNFSIGRQWGRGVIRSSGLAAVLGGTLACAQTGVGLGAASTFGVLAGTTITSTGLTVVNGDVGLFNGATITGFAGYGSGGTAVTTGSFQVENGLTLQAGTDLNAAYSALSAETPTTTGVTAFANQTLTAGVYSAPAALSVSGTLVLDGQGQSDPVFIFQVGSALNAALGTQIVLTGGATAANIYWEVGSSATLGGASIFQGELIADTSISAGTGAVIDGSLFAITGAVTLDSDTISAVPEPADTGWLVAGCALLAAAARAVCKKRPGQKRSQRC